MIFAFALTIVALVVAFTLRASQSALFAPERGVLISPLRYGHQSAQQPLAENLDSSKPAAQPEARTKLLSGIAESPWPMPTEQLATASKPRHYDLPSGAIMGLTVRAIDLC